MIGLLKALAWVRWRQARAALRGNRRRDPLEQVLGLSAGVARAIQTAFVLLAAAWFGLVGAAAGWFAGAGTPAAAGKAVLLAALGAGLATLGTVVGRLVAGPHAGHAETLQRLQLLPIHPRHLRALHLATGLAEPWPLLALPALGLLPLGLLASGHAGAAAVMLAAGLAFGLVLLLLGALASDGAALVLRNRRRAETLGLLLAFGLIVPAALAPLFVPAPGKRSTPAGRTDERAAREDAALGRAWHATPPGLYADVLRRVATGEPAWRGLAGLALWLVPLSLAAGVAWRKLLGEPDTEGGARGAGRNAELTPLPAIPPAVSAVALSHLWLARRSLMGRLDVLSTPLLCGAAVAAFTFAPAGVLPAPPSWLPVSFVLASGGVLLGLASIGNMLFNQFGVHGPGLARLFTSPLTGRDIVRGQALANAIQALFACLPCAFLPPLVLGGGTTQMWYAAWIGLCGTVVLALGFGALLSTLLCKAVDMGRLQADNPLPGLLAMVALPAMSLPPLFVAWMAGRQPHAGWVAINAAWLLLAAALGWGLLEAAARVLDRRRERLLLAGEGR